MGYYVFISLNFDAVGCEETGPQYTFLHVLSQLCSLLQTKVPTRIQWSPNVSAKAHAKH